MERKASSLKIFDYKKSCENIKNNSFTNEDIDTAITYFNYLVDNKKHIPRFVSLAIAKLLKSINENGHMKAWKKERPAGRETKNYANSFLSMLAWYRFHLDEEYNNIPIKRGDDGRYDAIAKSFMANKDPYNVEYVSNLENIKCTDHTLYMKIENDQLHYKIKYLKDVNNSSISANDFIKEVSMSEEQLKKFLPFKKKKLKKLLPHIFTITFNRKHTSITFNKNTICAAIISECEWNFYEGVIGMTSESSIYRAVTAFQENGFVDPKNYWLNHQDEYQLEFFCKEILDIKNEGNFELERSKIIQCWIENKIGD